MLFSSKEAWGGFIWGLYSLGIAPSEGDGMGVRTVQVGWREGGVGIGGLKGGPGWELT